MLKVVNGKLAYMLTVTSPEGLRIKYFYDQKTGLKLKQYTDVLKATIMEFDDYRDVGGGVKIPFSEKNAINGEPVEYHLKSAVVNSGVSETEFK